MVAIQAVARIIGDREVANRNVTILSDSQATIKGLSSNVFQRYFNEIAERYDIHIVWVTGHSGFPGNCRTDELARRDTTIELSDEFSNLGIHEGLQAHS